MDGYKIEISRQAYGDIRETYRYIARELKEPSIAQKLTDTIFEAIQTLAQLPERYAVVSDERLALEHYRKLPVENYLVFYVIFEQTKTVYISRVLYARREWQSIL